MFDLIQRFASRPAASSPGESTAAREERLRAAFAALPAGVLLCGLDGRPLLFNDLACALLGHTREELPQAVLHELTHPADAPRESAYLRGLQTGELSRYRIEKRVLDRNAIYRDVVVTASLVRGRLGTRDTLAMLIEEPQPREDVDAMSERILDGLADTAVIRCDVRGTIRGWNRGAQRLFGYSRDEIVGRHRRMLYRDGETWSEGEQDDLRVAEERQLLETEDIRRARDGRELRVRVSLMPVVTGGVVRGFVEVLHAAEPLARVVESLEARLQAERARSAELEREVLALRERLAPAEPRWTPIGPRGALGVLEELARGGRTGLLQLVSGERRKSIRLEEGCVASCASNERGQSIGDRLVRCGAITDAQRNKAVQMAAATNVAIGRALTILGVLSEGAVADAVREKVEDEIDELALWRDGRWTFAERELPRVKPIRATLALAELRAFAPAGLVASRKGTRYHRDGCAAMLRVREAERVPVVSALAGAEQGLEPCRICIHLL